VSQNDFDYGNNPSPLSFSGRGSGLRSAGRGDDGGENEVRLGTSKRSSDAKSRDIDRCFNINK
jgi:hypothetical protein